MNMADTQHKKVPSAPAPSSASTAIPNASSAPSGYINMINYGQNEGQVANENNYHPSFSATFLKAEKFNKVKIDLPKTKPKKKKIYQAPPRSIKITGRDFDNLSPYLLLKHERCVRRYARVISERLEEISRPPVRTIMNLWRERKDTLAPEVINRFRCMLNAPNLPLQTDDAYTLFKCMRESRKKQKNIQKKMVKNKPKRDIFEWQCKHGSYGKKSKSTTAPTGSPIKQWRINVSIKLTQALQKKLTPLLEIPLLDFNTIQLSNIVFKKINHLSEFHVSNQDIKKNSPKSQFLRIVANKITICINEIIEASEERMLLMDYDENEDVESMLPPKPSTPESSRSASPEPPDGKSTKVNSEKDLPLPSTGIESAVLPASSKPGGSKTVSPKSSLPDGTTMVMAAEPGSTLVVSPGATQASEPGATTTVSPKSSAPDAISAVSAKASEPNATSMSSPKPSALNAASVVSPKASEPGATSTSSPKPSAPDATSAVSRKTSEPGATSTSSPKPSVPDASSAVSPKASAPGAVLPKSSEPGATS